MAGVEEHAGAHASYRDGVKALLEQWGEGQAAAPPRRANGAAASAVPVLVSTSMNSTVITTDRDPSLSLLLPLLILLSTLLFLLIFFLIFLILVKRGRLTGRGGITLGDNDGPLDLSREEELDGEGGLRGIEQRWLEQQDEGTTAGYERAKLFQQQYLPNSMATDITLSQFLSIQEKGISAWSFEPDYETNSPLFVTSRTEVTFLEDGIGMAAQEGGACCVQSNLPLPRLNEVYYWEVKLFEKPESTNLAIGLSTKPYPSFRMPGWNRYSIGYSSSDGFKSYNYPFTAQSYGPPLAEGDVLGVGYRPRTGAVFFTRNGKKLEDAYVGLTKHNLFPTVAADGAAVVHVNLGQAGFVFIEANVKKWGLAPTIGTLAPPPAYGSERGSILLESATAPRIVADESTITSPSHRGAAPASTSTSSSSGIGAASTSTSRPRHERQPSNEQAAAAALGQPSTSSSSSSSHLDPGHSRQRPGSGHRRQPSGSTVPVRPSPLRTTVTRTRTPSTNSSSSSPVSIPGTASLPDEEDEEGDEGRDGEEDDLLPHNPPTPGQLDISLRAMSPFSRRIALEEQEERQQQQQQRSRGSTSPPAAADIPTSSTPPYHVSIAHGAAPPRLPGDVSPPSYALLDANQYPAGVAEAMLDSLPEDQLAALFAGIGNSASGSGGMLGGQPASVSSNASAILRAYEGRQRGGSASGGEDGQGQGLLQGGGTGLGLRGFFGNVWGRAGQGQAQNDDNV